MLILEDLYLGDVRPSDRSFKRNSQYAKALDEVVKAGDALTDSLTEKQKELFEEYMTAIGGGRRQSMRPQRQLSGASGSPVFEV